MTTNKKSRRKRLITGWVGLVGGAAVSVFSAYLLAQAMASLGWPSVEGRITHSRVESYTQREDNKTWTTYTPEVEYSYEVDGESYQGERVLVWGGYSGTDEEEASAITDRYPSGAVASVFYDPDKPSVSLLEPGVPPDVYAASVIGLGLLLGGGVYLWAVYREKEARWLARRLILLGALGVVILLALVFFASLPEQRRAEHRPPERIEVVPPALQSP